MKSRKTSIKALLLNQTFLAGMGNAFQPGGPGCLASATGDDPAKIALAGVYAGQAVLAVLGVLVIGGEYDTGMIRFTLAATPRRLTLLAAKASRNLGLRAHASQFRERVLPLTPCRQQQL